MGHPGDCGVLPSLGSLGLMTGERANLMAQWGTASIVGMIRGVRSEAWPKNLIHAKSPPSRNSSAPACTSKRPSGVLVRKGLLTNDEV